MKLEILESLWFPFVIPRKKMSLNFGMDHVGPVFTHIASCKSNKVLWISFQNYTIIAEVIDINSISRHVLVEISKKFQIW